MDANPTAPETLVLETESWIELSVKVTLATALELLPGGPIDEHDADPVPEPLIEQGSGGNGFAISVEIL